MEPAVQHELDGALVPGVKQWNWFSFGSFVCLCRCASRNIGRIWRWDLADLVPVFGPSMEQHFGASLTWQNGNAEQGNQQWHQNTRMKKTAFLWLLLGPKILSHYTKNIVGGKKKKACSLLQDTVDQAGRLVIILSWRSRMPQSLGTCAVKNKEEDFVLLFLHLVTLIESTYPLAVWSLSMDVWTRDKSCLTIP